MAQITEKELAVAKRIGGDVAQRITLDVGNGISPENSELDYSVDMLDFREGLERRFAEHRQQNPDAVLDVRD